MIDAFTGGDASIERSLYRMYENEPSMRERSGAAPGLMDYVKRAWAARSA